MRSSYNWAMGEVLLCACGLGAGAGFGGEEGVGVVGGGEGSPHANCTVASVIAIKIEQSKRM
jgi:hypothetical protein